MNCYFDTSALMKAYVDEPGTPRVLEILDEASRVTVSPVILVECASVLSRIHGEGKVTGPKRNEALEGIKRDVVFFDRPSFDEDFEREAIRVAGRHGLRSLDAIQLAGALVSHAPVDVFVSSDKRLLAAAGKEKLHVEDPAA